MAIKTVTVVSADINTALGGAPSAADIVILDKYGTQYTTGIIAADLTSLKITKGFLSSMTAANGAALTCVVNQAGAGVFTDESSCPRLEINSTSSAGVIKEMRIGPAVPGLRSINTCDCDVYYQYRPVTTRIESGADMAVATITAGSCNFVASAYPLTTLHAGGDAEIDLNRDCGTINIEGAASVSVNDTAVTPTTVEMRGGRFRPSRCGTITNLNGRTGTVDMRDVQTPLIVSNRACGPDVEFLFTQASYAMVTFTSVSGDLGGGPKITIT